MKRVYLYSTCAAAAVAFAVPGIHAQAGADPWARTVALPTACYQSQDQFRTSNQKAIEALAGDQQKQEAINSKANQKPSEQDPFALAQKIQEAMMKDPQAAMKMMQSMNAGDPAAAQASIQEQNEKTAKWQADEKALGERYKKAVDQANAPFVAQYRALQKKIGGNPNSPFLPESGTPSWAAAEADTIKRSIDNAYGPVCAQWFGPTGEMQAFMKRFKDYLVQDRIPFYQKSDEQRSAAYALMGTSAQGYKSTAAMEAVQDYMKTAGRLYGLRPNEVRCTAAKCQDGL